MTSVKREATKGVHRMSGTMATMGAERAAIRAGFRGTKALTLLAGLLAAAAWMVWVFAWRMKIDWSWDPWEEWL
jgi:hypothetical protein